MLNIIDYIQLLRVNYSRIAIRQIKYFRTLRHLSLKLESSLFEHYMIYTGVN